ncbi:MAG: Hint domain-containing protein, partial [Sulfitobacter sp.]|nr:Hint domain-containing protein [Sulfitobacter sp.]
MTNPRAEITPCFTTGTRIATPKGERKVEDLEVRDLIVTRDNGLRENRWTGARHLTAGDFASAA